VVASFIAGNMLSVPSAIDPASDFAPMVSSTNNRSQEQREIFSIAQLTCLRALASIRFGFSSYASTKRSYI
jgi:hypothetical protein